MFAEREHSRGQIGGLIYSLGLLIIFSLSFAQTQLSEAAALSPDIAVNLNISDNGGSVTINKRETIGIVLQSNIAAGCQWVLDTSALNSDVVGEVGVTDVADEDVSIIVGNYVEPDGEYVRWIFLARESGFSNIRLNYKNVTDNEIAATFEVAVTVLSDPNESPCPFSLVVLPDRNYEAIPGQKCVFLVKVIDEGSGYGKGTVVNISTMELGFSYDMTVDVDPPAILPGQVGEITVIPVGLKKDDDSPNALKNIIDKGQIRPNEPNDQDVDPNEQFENVSLYLTVTAERNGVRREEIVTVDVYPGEDLLNPLASEYRDRFIPWLAENYPELGITEDTVWEGTVVRPRILVVTYYLFFSEQWEMGLRWHVMIPPYDFAEIYLRKRGSDLGSTYDFKIDSLDAQQEPYVFELSPEGIWR